MKTVSGYALGYCKNNKSFHHPFFSLSRNTENTAGAWFFVHFSVTQWLCGKCFMNPNYSLPFSDKKLHREALYDDQ